MTTSIDKNTLSNQLQNDDHNNRTDADQAAIVYLPSHPSDIALLCGHVYGQLNVLTQRIGALEQQLGSLTTIVEQQSRQHGEYIAIIAACQKDTASALNREIERRALYPAIEAIVDITTELSRLQNYVSQLPDSGVDGDSLSKMQAEADISYTVAQEKLAHLNIQIVTPSQPEGFDPDKHTPCGRIDIEDPDLNGRISKLVVPGIVYQNKVLRRARVIVFHTKPSEDQR